MATKILGLHEKLGASMLECKKKRCVINKGILSERGNIVVDDVDFVRISSISGADNSIVRLGDQPEQLEDFFTQARFCNVQKGGGDQGHIIFCGDKKRELK